VVSINRNIVGYIKYLLVDAVDVIFVSYCYSYCDFVKTFESRHWFLPLWFVLYALLLLEFIYKNRNSLSVCLCHREHRRYFLAPRDNRPPARPARIPLGDTMCGYRTVVSVSSALYAVVTTTTNPVSRAKCA